MEHMNSGDNNMKAGCDMKHQQIKAHAICICVLSLALLSGVIQAGTPMVKVKKETVIEIDNRQSGEGEQMQLSNFWVIENQENLELEIYLTRLYENPKELFTTNAYKYTLSFEK